MISKQNWIVHAYVLGAISVVWLVAAVALSSGDRQGFAAIGDAIILFIVTAGALAHAVVSSLAVLAMRKVRHGALYAHAAAGALDLGVVVTMFAFG